MPRKLIVLSGSDVGQVFSLPEAGTVTLGRGREAQIRLNDLQVSRLHCQLEIQGNLLIRDIGSATGTLVNGQRISEHALRIGDLIRVGTTELRLQATDLADQPTVVPSPAGAATPPIAVKPGGPVLAIPLAGASAVSSQPIPVAIPVASSAPISTATPVPPPMAIPVEPVGLTGQTLGNYEVGLLIAQGQSGSVFRARNLKTNQDVALKVLWPHLTQKADVVQRLWRSANTMLSIRHPNLVALHEAGQTRAHCWLAMEFIDGECLTRVISRIGVAGMLDWRYAFRVAVQVGRALHTIHHAHIIHRNLTPDHVLIRASDKSAVLSGAVLAKALEGAQVQQITRPGEILGDVQYLAPEQVTAGEPVDARADIYCLGAMLYALLTGRPPLTASSLPETVSLIRTAEPARPKKFQMSISDKFEGVVLKMLAKRPQARFQTAAELLEELERVAKFQGMPLP